MEEAPGAVLAASAAIGFAGAFTGLVTLKRLLLDKYPNIPFVVQRFPLAPGVAADRVWVVPYRDTEAPAVVTNDRAAAERVQAQLLRVGWTYPGDVDNWEQPVDTVRGFVATSCAAQEAALRDLAAGAAGPDEVVVAGRARDEAHLERLTGEQTNASENKRLEIMSCVVPVDLD